MGLLLISTILSLLIGLAVGDGFCKPASAAALFVIMLLIATPSAPGLGFIAIIAKTKETNKIITLQFLMICLAFCLNIFQFFCFSF